MAEQKHLPSGKRDKSAMHIFSKRARTWILIVSATAIICFLLIPFCIDRIRSANTVFVRASALAAETPVPTPIPTSISFTATPTSSPSQSAKNDPVQISQYSLLQENDNFPAVQNLQLRLMDLGYLDSDEPNTVYGASTAVAVSLFQRTIQDDVTGVADVALQELLFSASAEPYEMKLGDTGTDVRSMQARLEELGYYESKVNGFFGAATEDAVKAFQKKNGLDISGVFSVDDRDILFSPSAKPKIDPTPTPSPTPKPTPKPTKRPSSSGGSSSGGSSSGGASSGGSSSGGSSSGGSSSGGSSSGGSSYNASRSVSGLLSVADAQRGKPYEWSEEGPDSFDCSGLVYFCLRTCDISTSRYSAAGFSEVSKWSKIDSIDALDPGDLVFFRNDSSSRISHTGIYIGGNKFVHASSSSGKVIVSSITTSYWTRNFMLGRRVF